MFKYICLVLFVTWSKIYSNAAEQSIYEQLESVAQEFAQLAPKTPVIVPNVYTNTRDIIKLIKKYNKFEDKSLRYNPVYKRLPKGFHNFVGNEDFISLIKRVKESKFRDLTGNKANVKLFLISNPQVFEKRKKNNKDGRNRNGFTYHEALDVKSTVRRYDNALEIERSFSPFRENELENIPNKNKLPLRMSPPNTRKEKKRDKQSKSDEAENEWGVTKKYSWANVHSSGEQLQKNTKKSKRNKRLPKNKENREVSSDHEVSSDNVENDINTLKNHKNEPNDGGQNDLSSESNGRHSHEYETKEFRLKKYATNAWTDEDTTEKHKKKIKRLKKHTTTEKDIIDTYLDEVEPINIKSYSESRDTGNMDSKKRLKNKHEYKEKEIFPVIEKSREIYHQNSYEERDNDYQSKKYIKKTAGSFKHMGRTSTPRAGSKFTYEENK